MLRYAITDRIRLATSEKSRRAALLDHARHCAAAGIDFLQLREKDLSSRDLVEIAGSMLQIFRAQHLTGKIRLLINSRADVAIATRADGVHLTSSEGVLTPEQVRNLYSRSGLPDPVVSISCHTLRDVMRVRALAPDLILFGPVFEKVVPATAEACPGERSVLVGTGLDLLRTICAAAGSIPVIALGGVTEANKLKCLQAGAAGIAGIRLFL